MKIQDLAKMGSDPGKYIKEELEEGLQPITERIDRLEKKLELLAQTAQRIEALLIKIQPVADLIKKVPFLK